MKRLLILVIVVAALTSQAQAQEFKKFRLGIGLGFAKPGGDGAGGGLLYAIEPGYRVSDAILANLRIEGAIIARGLSESVAGYSGNVAGIGSYTLNGQYYFSNNKFRPYAGVGFGMYSLAAVSFGTSTGAAAETKFGFYPRVGFDLGHFNVNIDYNIIGASKLEGTNASVKNSYIGIRLGAFFFGGRK